MTRDADWLAGILQAVDLVFFGGKMRDDGVSIRWKRFRRTRSQIQLGCFWPDEKLIEIHPVLRHEWVPLYVIVSLVYHECLHHVHKGALEEWHSEMFRRDEQRDPNFALSEAWIYASTGKLIAASPPKRVQPKRVSITSGQEGES